MHFKDKYPHLIVPLHPTSNTSCEIFYSEIGGMVGLKRAYDFHKVASTTNMLNHLSFIEYAENDLKFGQVPNNMEKIWASLHPLGEDEIIVDLSDYAMLFTNNDVVCALKRDLKRHKNATNLKYVTFFSCQR